MKPPPGPFGQPPPTSPGAAGRLSVKVASDATTAAVGQRVIVDIDVTNEGLQPLTNVKVMAILDPALKATVATEDHRKEPTGLSWTLASLPPRTPHRFEISVPADAARPASVRAGAGHLRPRSPGPGQRALADPRWRGANPRHFRDARSLRRRPGPRPST